MFNKLFIEKLMEQTGKSRKECLEYLGKSPANATHFFNYKALALEPEYFAKAYVLDALTSAVQEWAGQQKEVKSNIGKAVWE